MHKWKIICEDGTMDIIEADDIQEACNKAYFEYYPIICVVMIE